MAGMFSDPEQGLFLGSATDAPVSSPKAQGLLQMGIGFTPGFGDVLSAKDTVESLSKGEYGEAALNALGLLPFVPSLGGIIKGAKKTDLIADMGQENASKFVDEVGDSLMFPKAALAKPPKNTVKAYKLFRQGKDGQLYPLYVDAKTPVPLNKWLTAIAGEVDPKTGQVKSKIGPLAYRPGWHAGDSPSASHIGEYIDPTTGATLSKTKAQKLGYKSPTARRDDEVWAEVEMGNDVPWQEEALRRALPYKQNSKATGAKKGDLRMDTAQITDQVPYGGHYRYKTNPNMTGEWLIGGEVKVNRVLSDAEVKAINDAKGVQDLPRTRDIRTNLQQLSQEAEDFPFRNEFF